MDPSSDHDVLAKNKSFKEVLAGPSLDLQKVNFSLGDLKGVPALFVSDEDALLLAKPFNLTLIGKFAITRPPTTHLRKFVDKMKFEGLVRIDEHDKLNVVFRFSDERDYNRFFVHRYYKVFGVDMKVVKWSPFIDISEELPIVPIWICLPGLRYQFFNKISLFNIGKIFGNPLCLDSSTANCGNLSKARILVEIDVSKKLPDRIWLGSLCSGFYQDVIFENLPFYCGKCRVFGHDTSKCRIDHGKLHEVGLDGPSYMQNGKTQIHCMSEDNPPLRAEVVGKEVVNKLLEEGEILVEDDGINNNGEMNNPGVGMVLSNVTLQDVGRDRDKEGSKESDTTLRKDIQDDIPINISGNINGSFINVAVDNNNMKKLLENKNTVDLCNENGCEDSDGNEVIPQCNKSLNVSFPTLPDVGEKNILFSNSLNYGHLTSSPGRVTRSCSKGGGSLNGGNAEVLFDGKEETNKRGRKKNNAGPRAIALDAIMNPSNFNV